MIKEIDKQGDPYVLCETEKDVFRFIIVEAGWETLDSFTKKQVCARKN